MQFEISYIRYAFVSKYRANFTELPRDFDYDCTCLEREQDSCYLLIVLTHNNLISNGIKGENRLKMFVLLLN